MLLAATVLCLYNTPSVACRPFLYHKPCLRDPASAVRSPRRLPSNSLRASLRPLLLLPNCRGPPLPLCRWCSLHSVWSWVPNCTIESLSFFYFWWMVDSNSSSFFLVIFWSFEYPSHLSVVHTTVLLPIVFHNVAVYGL